jgi:hypothetical protein
VTNSRDSRRSSNRATWLQCPSVRWTFTAVVLFTLRSFSALAAGPVPLPPADLGQTNIQDGDGGPGALFELITLGYGANRLTNSRGASVPGSNQQQIEAAVLHPIFVANTSWLGAYPGVEVLVPFSHVYNDFAGTPSASASGLGDITVAPFLQWSKIGPKNNLSLRAAVQFVMPSGKYGYVNPVNTGQGDWQVSPYLAATWHLSPEWELSARLIYDWSSAAGVSAADGGPASSQPGDFLVLNTSASYAATKKMRLGIGSYVLRQLRSSTVDGISQPDNLERVYAAGPVARWQVGNTTILAAGYKEFGAQNRPEGFSFNLRFQHPF